MFPKIPQRHRIVESCANLVADHVIHQKRQLGFPQMRDHQHKVSSTYIKEQRAAD